LVIIFLLQSIKHPNMVGVFNYNVFTPSSEVTLTKLKMVGKVPKDDSWQRGTMISFMPDSQVFSVNEFDLSQVLEHYRQQAYLTKGVHIVIQDDRINFVYQFKFEGGLVSYIKHMNRNKNIKSRPIYINKTVEQIMVECAIQYTDEFSETVLTFANNIHTAEGGIIFI